MGTGERNRPMAAEQGELAGMPRRLYPCTPTRLGTWLDCPRRYRFAYLDRPQPPKGPPWAHNALGAAVHVALAWWWTQPFAARVPSRAAARLRADWNPETFAQQGFRDAVQSRAVRERAAVWVEDYLAGVDPGAEPVGVERTVSSPTRTLVLSGRVDRVDDRPGDGLVVVDYKTGRRPPQDGDARSSLALAIYAVAVTRTMHRPCHRVELHHLPSGGVVAAEHDEESLRRKVSEAESIAADASRADARYADGDRGDDRFPPRPSNLCSWCDWRAHCREGQAAAPQVEPWASVSAAELGR
jgi:putative RecB family exonuclease